MKDTSRRTFLTAVTELAGTVIIPKLTEAQSAATDEWDMSWLDKLTGKHKQVFDVEKTDTLGVVRNWLNAYRDVYGIQYSDLTAIVGIAGSGFPINASDDLYQKFPIGEHWKLDDPETKKPALRNIYLDGGKTTREKESTVRALQARGVIFWQCNNALHRIAGELGEKVKRPEPDVYAELKAGLNPGVLLVPAHTMLIGLAQERGCAYEKL